VQTIKVTNLTKDYGTGKGKFNISFTISRGEVVGFSDQMAVVKQQLFDIC